MAIDLSVLDEDKESITKEIDLSVLDDPKIVPDLIEEDDPRLMDTEEVIASSPSKIGKMEAAFEGLKQGGTLGYGEEIGAAGQEALDVIQSYMNKFGLDNKAASQVDQELLAQGFTGDLSPSRTESYKAERDLQREELAKIQEAQPGAYLGGAIAGSIPAAVATGGMGIPALAAEGAVAGLGTSEAELIGDDIELGEAAKDIAGGAAMGLAIPGAVQGVKAAAPAVKKGVGALADIAAPMASKVKSSARKFKDIVADLPSVKESSRAYKWAKRDKPTHTEAMRDKISDDIIEGGEKSVTKIDEMKKVALENQSNAIDNASAAGIEVNATELVNKHAATLDDLIAKFRNKGMPENEIKQFSEKFDELFSNASMVDVDPSVLRKLQDNIKQFTMFGDTPLTDRHLKKLSQDVVNDINTLFKEAIPEVRTADEHISELNNLLEAIKFRSGGRDLFKNTDKEGKLFALLDSMSGEGIKKRHKLKSIRAAIDEVKKLHPEDSDAMKIMNELQKQLDEVPELLSTAKKSATEGIETSILGGKSLRAKMGSIAGSAAKPTFKKIGEISRWSGQQFDDLIEQVSTRAPQSASRDKFIEVLKKIAAEDQRGRNALIFGLQQSPEYRQYMQEFMPGSGE